MLVARVSAALVCGVPNFSAQVAQSLNFIGSPLAAPVVGADRRTLDRGPRLPKLAAVSVLRCVGVRGRGAPTPTRPGPAAPDGLQNAAV